MKKILISSICAIMAFAFTACKPAANDGSSPSSSASLAETAKATQAKVEKAILAVPQDISVFMYYYPSISNIQFNFGSEENFTNLFNEIADNKDISEVFDLLVEKMNKPSSDEIIGGADGPTSIFVKNKIPFLKKGGFKDLVHAYAGFFTSFGFAGYAEKIDMAKPETTNYAYIAFLNAEKVQNFVDAFVKENSDEFNTGEVNSKTGVLKYYFAKSPFNDGHLAAVAHIAADRIIIANTPEMLAAFVDNMESPKKTSVLDNSEYKKLRAEMKNPVMGIFADFKGFALDMSDMGTAMGYGMADAMLGLKKMESAALFLENMSEKNISQTNLLVSADDGAALYELFKAQLPKKNLLETSPKNSFVAGSLALPKPDSQVYKTIMSASQMWLGDLNGNPIFETIKNNLEQINVSASDLKKILDDGKPNMVAGLYFSKLNEVLANPMLAQMIRFENQNGVEIAQSPMIPEGNVIVKPGADSIAFSDSLSPENLLALSQGKSESLKDLANFKTLSEKLGGNNALEIYFDYMRYFEMTTAALADMPQDTPESKLMGAYMDVITSKATKDYKIAASIKSERKMINLTGFIFAEMDVNEFSKAIKEFDWAAVKKLIKESEAN